MGGGRVLRVGGVSDWKKYVQQGTQQKKIVVVDFTATWCGPCKTMAPVFEKLSDTYTNAIFLKVDVDENQDLASDFGVSGIPAFHLLKDGQKVDEVIGSNAAGLEAMVKKHYTKGTFQGQGHTLGSSSSNIATPAEAVKEEPDASSSNFDVDEAKPITSLQIRMQDGSRLVGKFNMSHTLNDVRAYIRRSHPEVPPGFQLQASYPPRSLTDNAATIADAGLQNAALTVKF